MTVIGIIMNEYLISKAVGKKITYYRKLHGLSLSELSKVASVSQQQQSRYERGLNRIKVDKLFIYAQFFNIDIIDFFPKEYSDFFEVDPIINNSINSSKRRFI